MEYIYLLYIFLTFSVAVYGICNGYLNTECSPAVLNRIWTMHIHESIDFMLILTWVDLIYCTFYSKYPVGGWCHMYNNMYTL